MVSPRTHLVNKSWVPLQNHWLPFQKITSPTLKMLGPLCDQIVKPHWKLKEICVVKQQTQEQPQKSHEQDILQKHPQIDWSIFAYPTGCMPWTFVHLWRFLCIRDTGCRVNKIILLWLTFCRTVGQTRNETLLVVFSQTVPDSPVEWRPLQTM